VEVGFEAFVELGSTSGLDEEETALHGRVDVADWAACPPPMITSELAGADSLSAEDCAPLSMSGAGWPAIGLLFGFKSFDEWRLGPLGRNEGLALGDITWSEEERMFPPKPVAGSRF